MLKAINLTIVFLLELAMLASLGYYAFTRPCPLLARTVLAFALVTIAIIIWARWGAPKSAKRLKMPYQVAFRVIMFSIAATLLYLSGPQKLAFIFFALIAITQFIFYFTGD